MQSIWKKWEKLRRRVMKNRGNSMDFSLTDLPLSEPGVSWEKKGEKNSIMVNASAGSRTRVYCLEGNYPNRWTTDALMSATFHYLIPTEQKGVITHYSWDVQEMRDKMPPSPAQAGPESHYFTLQPVWGDETVEQTTPPIAWSMAWIVLQWEGLAGI